MQKNMQENSYFALDDFFNIPEFPTTPAQSLQCPQPLSSSSIVQTPEYQPSTPLGDLESLSDIPTELTLPFSPLSDLLLESKDPSSPLSILEQSAIFAQSIISQIGSSTSEDKVMTRKNKSKRKRKHDKTSRSDSDVIRPPGVDPKDFPCIDFRNSFQSRNKAVRERLELATQAIAALVGVEEVIKKNTSPIYLILVCIGYDPITTKIRSEELLETLRKSAVEKFKKQTRQQFHETIAIRAVWILIIASQYINIILQLPDPEDKDKKKNKSNPAIKSYVDLLKHMKKTKQEFVFRQGNKNVYRSNRWDRDCLNNPIDFKLEKTSTGDDALESTSSVPMQTAPLPLLPLPGSESQGFPFSLSRLEQAAIPLPPSMGGQIGSSTSRSDSQVIFPPNINTNDFNPKDFVSTDSVENKLNKFTANSNKNNPTHKNLKLALQALANLAGTSVNTNTQVALYLLLGCIDYEPTTAEIGLKALEKDLHKRIVTKFKIQTMQEFHNTIAFRIVKALIDASKYTNTILKLPDPEDKDKKKNKSNPAIKSYVDLLKHMKKTKQEFVYHYRINGTKVCTYRSNRLDRDGLNNPIDFKLKTVPMQTAPLPSSSPSPVSTRTVPTPAPSVLSSLTLFGQQPQSKPGVSIHPSPLVPR